MRRSCGIDRLSIAACVGSTGIAKFHLLMLLYAGGTRVFDIRNSKKRGVKREGLGKECCCPP
jgi:hypothetical protein